MYPSVKEQIPEFIKEYIIYCDCFTDRNKQKTCWVFTRNLKLFEFCRKQLVASIDLQATCLNHIKNNIANYNGPKGKWYEDSGSLSQEKESVQNPISFGKYIFSAASIYKTYIIIQCWNKCIVLKRLPDFKGFKIEAQYDDLLSYRIVNGLIKYCPVLELKFQSGEVLKTDFQDELEQQSWKEDAANEKPEVHKLLEQIRCTKTELQLHESTTAQLFHSIQNKLTLGEPIFRTCKLEEKQILARCGDIWKRFTVHDDLVIGIPLVNQCNPPNLSIIRNLFPVLLTEHSPENSIKLQYRLFQLRLKFDQLDELETLLECEDEQLQEHVWCANGDLQLLPDSFAVLLIKLKTSQIISLKEGALILNYEVIRHLHLTASETLNTTFTMPLQLFLQNIDFHKLLFDERSNCEIKFLPLTLHQDFLTIAMTASVTNLTIVFKNCEALDIFENFLLNSLEFSKPTFKSDYNAKSDTFKTVFYNKNPVSSWFGSLILRLKEATEYGNDQCSTKWKIYCQNFDKTMFLIKTFLNEHLTLQCNIINISSCDSEGSFKCEAKLENALRQELEQLQEIIRSGSHNNHSQEYLKNLQKLYQLQMNSDTIAKFVKEN